MARTEVEEAEPSGSESAGDVRNVGFEEWNPRMRVPSESSPQAPQSEGSSKRRSSLFKSLVGELYGDLDATQHSVVVNDRGASADASSLRLSGFSLQRDSTHLEVMHAWLPDEAFRKHVRSGGLCFRKLQIERIFLDNHARLHKHLVYVGYALLVVLVLFVCVLTALPITLDRRVCGAKKDKELCTDAFRSEYLEALNQTSELSDYTDEISGTFQNPGVIFMLVIAGVGCVSHWFIHRLKWIRQKFIAILVTTLLYSVIAIVTTYQIVHHYDPDPSTWIKNVEYGETRCKIRKGNPSIPLLLTRPLLPLRSQKSCFSPQSLFGSLARYLWKTLLYGWSVLCLC